MSNDPYDAPKSEIHWQKEKEDVKESPIVGGLIFLTLLATIYFLAFYVIPIINGTIAISVTDINTMNYLYVRRLSDVIFTALLYPPFIYALTIKLRYYLKPVLISCGAIMIFLAHKELLYIEDISEIISIWYSIFSIIIEAGSFYIVYKFRNS